MIFYNKGRGFRQAAVQKYVFAVFDGTVSLDFRGQKQKFRYVRDVCAAAGSFLTVAVEDISVRLPVHTAAILPDEPPRYNLSI